jgi:hypothetical protein
VDVKSKTQYVDLAGHMLRIIKLEHGLDGIQVVNDELFDMGQEDSIAIYDGSGVKLRTLSLPLKVIPFGSIEIHSLFCQRVVLPDKRLAFIDSHKGTVYFADATCHIVKEISVPALVERQGIRFMGRVATRDSLFLLGSTKITAIDLATYEVSTFSTFPDFVNYPEDKLGQDRFWRESYGRYDEGRVTYAAGKIYFLWGQQIFAAAKESLRLQPIAFVQIGRLRGIAATSGHLFALVDEVPAPRKKQLESYLYEVHPQDGTMTQVLALVWSNGLAVARDPATPDLPLPEPKVQFFDTK